MSGNNFKKPPNSAMGQSTTCGGMKGGYNKPAKPFGMTTGSNNKASHASPQHGVAGQRLASNSSGKGATGYPKGYR